MWRPGFRGGRGGRGSSRGSFNPMPSRHPVPTHPAPPLGDLLKTFTPEQCDDEDENASSNSIISNCEFLASYNWTNATDPSIISPGMPAKWNPPEETKKLPEDFGEYLLDHNAARHPDHPMEPAVKAVLAQNPGFSTENIDIFGCTSTLGSLLRFLKKDDKPFRFTVEAVGRTVFFVRRENAPDEKIAGPDGCGPRGYGHTFPERYTQWQDGVEGSASHQRIISYGFARLKCLVRFEADGYLEQELEEGEMERNEGGFRHDTTRAATPPEIDNIKVRGGGKMIPQHTIFELKTRSAKRKSLDHMADSLPRLWLAQIPFFILAFHDSGTFTPEDISVTDARSNVATWEDENTELLDRFGCLLTNLVYLARDNEFGKYEVRAEKPGILEIRRQGGTVTAPLSSPLTWIWSDHDGSSSGSDSEGVSLGAEVKDVDAAAFSDEEDELPEDFTACSDACDYCGRCSYKLR